MFAFVYDNVLFRNSSIHGYNSVNLWTDVRDVLFSYKHDFISSEELISKFSFKACLKL